MHIIFIIFASSLHIGVVTVPTTCRSKSDACGKDDAMQSYHLDAALESRMEAGHELAADRPSIDGQMTMTLQLQLPCQMDLWRYI